jgi:hypothetical protein
VWPGVRGRAAQRQSPALTPGQRRRRRRLDSSTAQFGSEADRDRAVTSCANRTTGLFVPKPMRQVLHLSLLRIQPARAVRQSASVSASI